MSAVERLTRCPDWPARMTADIACLYMGVSKSTFLARYGAQGVKEGANTLWARIQLDRLIARQFGLPDAARSRVEERDDSWDDLA